MQCNFEAIHVRIVHTNIQASGFTGVGGEWGDRQKHTGCQAFWNRSLSKISKLFPGFARDGWIWKNYVLTHKLYWIENIYYLAKLSITDNLMWHE